MLRALAPLLIATGLAACGGDDVVRPVDHVGYEVRLAPVPEAVDAALHERGDASGQLRDVASGLERVSPPANAALENAELAIVLRYLAEDLEADDMLAFAEDYERLQDVLYALGDNGYVAVG